PWSRSLVLVTSSSLARRPAMKQSAGLFLWVALATGAALFGSQDSGKDAAAEELKKLSGTFTVTLFVDDGKKLGEDELKTMRVSQMGAEWKFQVGKEVTEGRDTVIPGKSPREIDSTYTSGPLKGKTVKGIYEADGETVRYCWAAPSKDRPRAFASTP